MESSKKIKYLLFIFLVCWVVIAAGRTVLNISKIYTEEKDWVFLSESEKREKLYGDMYSFFTLINDKGKSSDEIILISKDGKPFFFGRYFLYPKKIFWLTDPHSLEQKSRKNTIIAIYHPKDFDSAQIARIQRKFQGNIYYSND